MLSLGLNPELSGLRQEVLVYLVIKASELLGFSYNITSYSRVIVPLVYVGSKRNFMLSLGLNPELSGLTSILRPKAENLPLGLCPVSCSLA